MISSIRRLEIARRYQQRLREQNPELAKARKDKWYADNPGAKRDIDRRAALKYSRVHPEKRRATRRGWKLRNPDKVRAEKRQYAAAKRGHVPMWADRDQIRSVYDACPPGHHVDHVIPLRGKTVSGLHVHTNLQYLLGSENCRKGNRLSADIQSCR